MTCRPTTRYYSRVPNNSREHEPALLMSSEEIPQLQSFVSVADMKDLFNKGLHATYIKWASCLLYPPTPHTHLGDMQELIHVLLAQLCAQLCKGSVQLLSTDDTILVRVHLLEQSLAATPTMTVRQTCRHNNS